MTNRDYYIAKRNEFDLLVGMQEVIGSGMCKCVIEALTAQDSRCTYRQQCGIDTCKKCIQRWLNKEKE